MKNICFYFQVHQPFRLKTYRFFEIGQSDSYYDDSGNLEILKKVAEKCYLPANQLLLDLIKKHEGNFKVAFSISGSALEQFEKYSPEVIESFAKLSDTGCVEFLAETWNHSLASLVSQDEFVYQVNRHRDKINALFGQKPEVFRNTELIYSNQIGEKIASLGFKGILTEGAESIIANKNPNRLYHHPSYQGFKILLKNYRLSDDIAFRFSQKNWEHYPLTSAKFTQWLDAMPEANNVINLFMDYETFGEHQWKENGIFDFLKELPDQVLKQKGLGFITPSQVINTLSAYQPLEVPEPVSWADSERDLSAWLGNNLQKDAFKSLYKLEEKVRLSNDKQIWKDWGNLQNSDHFYYMSTKKSADGQVHQYFSPYSSPYQAFINYMNVLSDFQMRIERVLLKKSWKTIPERDMVEMG